MPIPGTVEVLGKIAPPAVIDTFPVTDPTFGLGGLRTVSLFSDLASIPGPRLQEGMVAYVSGGTAPAYYSYINSNWVLFNNSFITLLSSNSANWQSTYLTVSALSASWGSGNRAQEIKYLNSYDSTLSADRFNIFVKVLSGQEVFTYSNFTSGNTITVYLSGNHPDVIGHYFPINTYFNNLGNSNILYSFSGCLVKASIQNLGSIYLAETELINLNVQQFTKSGDYMVMESIGFLFQEDISRILLE